MVSENSLMSSFAVQILHLYFMTLTPCVGELGSDETMFGTETRQL